MVNNKINVNVIDGLQPILDKVIDYDNITNCITEIPQDIKLELNNGTLTLKAGSKVYVPNGAGKFDEYTSTSDKTVTNTTNGQYFVFTTKTFGYLSLRATTKAFSGTSATGVQYGVWYDTTNNLVKYTSGGTDWLSSDGWTLPLALITVSDGKITSIDQVFNGFGYIGSTVFALPGVKGLIPNGRNADGTLKNIEFIAKNVSISVFSDLDRNGVYLTESKIERFATKSYRFDEKENIHYNIADNTLRLRLLIGTIEGNITSFTPKLPFRAVDQNDFNKLDEEVATLDAQNVKLTGNQTIGGTKTFTSHIYQQAESPRMIVRDMTLTRGQAGDGGDAKFQITDKNNLTLGELRVYLESDGGTSTCIGTASVDSSGNQIYKTGLRHTVHTNGTSEVSINSTDVVYTPTPVVHAGGKQTVNAEFIANKFKVVDSKPSSPTTGVYYFIKDDIPQEVANYDYVVDYKAPTSSDPTWYRVYKSGWVEQGGTYKIATTGQGTITFKKTMKDTNYSFIMNKSSSDASSWTVMEKTNTRSTSSVGIQANLTGYELIGDFVVSGQGA